MSRFEALFLGVICSPRGLHIPSVPAHFALQGHSIQGITATHQRPIGNHNQIKCSPISPPFPPIFPHFSIFRGPRSLDMGVCAWGIARGLLVMFALQGPSIQEMAATHRRPIGNHNHHSRLMLVLVPQSGNFVPQFQGNGAIPNFAFFIPPPLPFGSRNHPPPCRLWSALPPMHLCWFLHLSDSHFPTSSQVNVAPPPILIPRQRATLCPPAQDMCYGAPADARHCSPPQTPASRASTNASGGWRSWRGPATPLSLGTCSASKR